MHHDSGLKFYVEVVKSGQVDIIFIEFSKAFDLICHDILLANLQFQKLKTQADSLFT